MNKYGNKKAVRNGIIFDSQKEAARYDQLMLQSRIARAPSTGCLWWKM